MQFASLQFAVFIPLLALVYFALPPRHRWAALLLASVYFYMSFIPVYVLLALALSLLDYCGALALERSPAAKRRGLYLSLIAIHLLALLWLKYNNFLGENLSSLLGRDFTASGWLAPVGLSYQTLMSISYLSEVHAGRFPAARKLHTVALYLLFFPQLLAGPIERPQHTMPQFEAGQGFDYARVTDGLKRMAFGFFKKLVVADRLAVIVGTVYGNVRAFDGPQLMLATLLYAWQIYYDFSGYTDIALGTAQLFGIRLSENFKQPYFSRSVTEFWQRWHISLSTWLRDYLYFPLARKLRSPRWRWLALFTTFAISGLWHGAAWTFAVWGALHGLFMIVELWLKRPGAPAPSSPWLEAAKTIATFIAVSFAWIFFRAADLNDAGYIVTHLFSNLPAWAANLTSPAFFKDALIHMGFSLSSLVIVLISLPLLWLLDRMQSQQDLLERLNQLGRVPRWAVYYLLVVAIAFLGMYGASGFIYFQF
jgi:D-alanyl-lipoteichoic acid acyltransferase DltB (MBOAT superfamily)